jgi:glycine dehydrogenase subunit 2
MLTNPNTLGLFESRITEVAAAAHEAGALLYYDGANMNALMGICRPGDMGFDVVHLNLHKTFSTPHGGGGPGAGPVGVQRHLEPFLPSPRIVRDKTAFRWSDDFPRSIGRLRAFHGNVGVMIRAYAYARALGREGVERVARAAIINANYLRARLRDAYDVPYDRACMHEFVVSASRQKEHGVSAMDVAKRLIDFGFHPPTVYFPLIVQEALMIEPTETESRETLDRFADAMVRIAREAEAGDPRLQQAPHATVVRRLDEVRAARRPDLARRADDAAGNGKT